MPPVRKRKATAISRALSFRSPSSSYSSSSSSSYRPLVAPIYRRITAWRPTSVFRTKQIVTTVGTFNATAGAFTAGTSTAPMKFALSAANPTYAAFAFRLVDCSQVATFTSLFDQYMIEKVRFRLMPGMNTEGVTGGAPIYSGYCVRDYDDGVIPTSLDVLREYDNAMVVTPLKGIDVTLKPRMAAGVYGGAVFTNFANTQPLWIDSASTGVEHYGVKLAFPTTAAATVTTYVIEVTLFLAFRAVR